MRRRALLSATATALAIPLVSGCSRDDGGGGGGGDGGDGDSGNGGGGGGPYGRISVDDPAAEARRSRTGSAGPGSAPSLGPDPDGG